LDRADLNKDVTAGKTIGFGVTAASDITLEGGSASGGSFPLNGNLMTVAAVSDFGRLTMTGIANSTTVDPGTNNVEVMKFQLVATNQDVKVSRLHLKMLGSINSSDLANFQLFQGRDPGRFDRRFLGR